MDCHDFEDRFETFLAGELPAGERAACREHLDRCPACRELLELARPPVEADNRATEEDLVGRILARTAGPACGRAGELLASRLDGSDAGEDPLERELLELHLAGCDDCRALARVLVALARDLPSLAEVRPDPRFVDDVVARAVPVTVRWRRALSRSWSRRWSSWVRRPRFAWEAAFVLTLAFLPVLSSAAAPLAETARGMTAESPVSRIVSRADRALGSTGRTLLDLEPVARAGRTVSAAREVVEGLRPRAGRWVEGWTEDCREAVGGYLGTLRSGAASFLVKAADDDVATRRPEANDETSSENPTDTRAADGSKGETK